MRIVASLGRHGREAARQDRAQPSAYPRAGGSDQPRACRRRRSPKRGLKSHQPSARQRRCSDLRHRLAIRRRYTPPRPACPLRHDPELSSMVGGRVETESVSRAPWSCGATADSGDPDATSHVPRSGETEPGRRSRRNRASAVHIIGEPRGGRNMQGLGERSAPVVAPEPVGSCHGEPEERNYAAIERLEALLVEMRKNQSTPRETEAIREIGFEIAIAIREVGAMLTNVGWEQTFATTESSKPPDA